MSSTTVRGSVMRWLPAPGAAALALIALAATPAAAIDINAFPPGGVTLNQAGATYNLRVSTPPDFAGTAIRITANNITVNLNGFVLDGDDAGIDFGIFVEGARGARIDGPGSIQDFAVGIHLVSGDNALIQNVTVQSNTVDGIALFSESNNNTLHKNVSNGNGFHGIFLFFGSDSNTLISNTTNGNAGHGVEVATNNNRLVSNFASGNGAVGILLALGSSNSVENNECNNNGGGTFRGGSGILVVGAVRNHFSRNTARNNVEHGIYIDAGSTQNTIVNNTALNNNTGGGAFFDLYDDTTAPPCLNLWRANTFNTRGGNAVNCIF